MKGVNQTFTDISFITGFFPTDNSAAADELHSTD
jgi:hypothetical protein